MSISPFAFTNPTSFGFDTPGPAIAHPGSAIDKWSAASEAPPTTPLSPAPASARSIDPMLLVYQERVETFRIVANVVRRAVSALLGRRYSRVAPRRATQTLATH